MSSELMLTCKGLANEHSPLVSKVAPVTKTGESRKWTGSEVSPKPLLVSPKLAT